jgi:ABC-2 type transport system ATP-binding protein
LRDDGATVVLTTQFIEEAERLCERVAILHHGSVVDVDSPQSLIGRFRENVGYSTTTLEDVFLRLTADGSGGAAVEDPCAAS